MQVADFPGANRCVLRSNALYSFKGLCSDEKVTDIPKLMPPRMPLGGAIQSHEDIETGIPEYSLSNPEDTRGIRRNDNPNSGCSPFARSLST